MTTTIKECLYNTIHHNDKSLKVIAEEIGMSENYLTRAALPDADESDTGTGCRFPLKKLVPLIKATNDYSVLDAIEQSVVRVGVPLPPLCGASTADICRLTMQSVGEFGELVREVERAIADNQIKPSERARIQKEGYEALQAILGLLLSCKIPGKKIFEG
jgi:hypothetical protein